MLEDNKQVTQHFSDNSYNIIANEAHSYALTTDSSARLLFVHREQ